MQSNNTVYTFLYYITFIYITYIYIAAVSTCAWGSLRSGHLVAIWLKYWNGRNHQKHLTIVDILLIYDRLIYG